jgi:hypothetical protein
MGNAVRYTNDQESQMQIVNNAFMKSISGLDRFQSGTAYFSWAKQIVRREIIVDFRKNKRYKELFQYRNDYLTDSLGIWVPGIHDTTIYHTSQYIDSTSKKVSFTNRYSWISIPLYAGYRFGFGNYELIPRIGAQFNFGIPQNTGQFLNDSLSSLVEYHAIRFTLSYLIQLEARRNFGKWHIFVNPYFKSIINPAISGHIIRRRYSSWGIQLGIGLML